MKQEIKKPFNLFEWLILGIISGIGLGIVIVLILLAVRLIKGGWPADEQDWGVLKWSLSLALFMFGAGGAVIGGIFGIIIGVARSPRE